MEAATGRPALLEKEGNGNRDPSKAIQKQTSIFHWQDVCYDIKIKSETRRILDHVDGWVKPGTLTALMVCTEKLRNPSFELLLTFAREFLVLARLRF